MVSQSWKTFPRQVCVHILRLGEIVEFEISFYCPSNSNLQEIILLFYNCDVTNNVCALIYIRTSSFFKRNLLKGDFFGEGSCPFLCVQSNVGQEEAEKKL